MPCASYQCSSAKRTAPFSRRMRAIPFRLRQLPGPYARRNLDSSRMPVPRAMVSACAMPPMMSKFTAGSHTLHRVRGEGCRTRGDGQTLADAHCRVLRAGAVPAVAPGGGAAGGPQGTPVIRVSGRGAPRRGACRARLRRRWDRRCPWNAQRERTAAERLGRAVVDERDNRASRARVRSPPQRSRGHREKAPSSIERRKETGKALRWPGRSRKAPSGVIQAFHCCGANCGASAVALLLLRD